MEGSTECPEAELLAEVPFFQLLDDEERNVELERMLGGREFLALLSERQER